MCRARRIARKNLPSRELSLRFRGPRARSDVAAAFWAGHREDFLDCRVILVAAAGERVRAGGVEAPTDKKALVDMEGDYLAEREHGSAQRPAQRPDLDHLDHLAFQGGRALGDARR